MKSTNWLSLIVSTLTGSTAFLVNRKYPNYPYPITQHVSQMKSSVVVLFDRGTTMTDNEPDFDAMMDDDDDWDETEDDLEDDDDDWEETEDDDEEYEEKSTLSRWSSLKTKATTTKYPTKSRRQQVVASTNPNTKESKQDKKRRMMMFVKDKNRERKLASRVVRTIPLTMRTPLSALTPGSKWTGTVISLTRFGAYVDIGTECDGLLHISQITSEKFVTNLQDYMTPGDEIEVTIQSINPQLKKLHLTLLPFLSKENSNPNDTDDTDDDTDRIVLEDVDIDDELWGELIRVTDYGSYVELGAEVSGFLHFMDHPLYGAEPGAHPSTFMSVGERVRVWVADVDRDRRRIRVTANRPSHLPGPRREFR